MFIFCALKTFFTHIKQDATQFIDICASVKKKGRKDGRMEGWKDGRMEGRKEGKRERGKEGKKSANSGVELSIVVLIY